MNIQINNPSKTIINELTKALEDLEHAKILMTTVGSGYSNVNKAEGRIEAIISMLSVEE